MTSSLPRRLVSCLQKPLVMVLAIAVLLGTWSYSRAQQLPSPTPQQMQLLNSLPPSQRQEILAQYQQFQQTLRRQAAAASQQSLQGASVSQTLPQDPLLDEEFLRELEAQARLTTGSTIVIDFTPNETRVAALSASARSQLEGLQDRLVAGNPYELDSEGNVYLPGVPTIALAGLDVDEAAIRLGAESSLRNFDILVTLLPLEPVGVDALEPFGYDLFDRVRSEARTGSAAGLGANLGAGSSLGLGTGLSLGAAFEPDRSVPVPADYVIGPGDTVNVQLFGNQNVQYSLTVSREGAINFPEIGPINVGGMNFNAMREIVTQRVTEQMIGVQVSVTLGELRTIRIFVVGDVERPGSYPVSALSTTTHGLFVSGGVTEVGSLRQIELKRDGETVAELDLYDLLLRGDTSGDERLLPGDVIFVPPIGNSVSVAGSVRRPAIYELNGETTIDEIIGLAGGLTPTADRASLKLERVVPGRGVSVRDISLNGPTASVEPLRDGDVLRVLPNLEQLEDAVRLVGNVYQPGLYEWDPGMRLTDILDSPERVKLMSDVNYVLIRREIEPNVYIEARSADLQAAWRRPDGPANIELMPRDTVYVFNLEVGRSQYVVPLLDELRAQTPSSQPVAVARVGGQVRAPGEYPLEPGMRISDLVRAGGGLSESAYLLDSELTRYEVVGGEYRETAFVTVDLDGIIRGDDNADLYLTPHDYFNVREVPQWRQQQTVELIGEIRFPGTYPIQQGETLSSVLARAGGLTEYAFADGSVFLRQELREREREQLMTLASRIQSDLAAISLSSETGSTQAITVGQSLVEQLRNAEPVGRLVIDLQELTRDPSQDIVLKGGDQLLVPEVTQSVTVLGEVQYATSHLYDTALDRDDYISRSGGLTSRADQRRIYVVRANGEVVARSGSRWFASRRTSNEILPGDTIVVPMDIDTGRRLSFWGSVTQIIYNLAIAAAAVNSF